MEKFTNLNTVSSPNAHDDNDDLNNGQEARGFMWGETVKVDPNSTYDTVAYVPEGSWQGTMKHFRTDPKGHRDLFMKFRGFSGTHPFAIGEGYEKLASPVAVHALDETLVNDNSLSDYNIDVATVSLENRALGTENPHIDRWTTRNWTFKTLGKSSFGGDSVYGATCFVYKKSLDALFNDKPHHDYTTFKGIRSNQMKDPTLWDIDPNGMLDPINNVEDANDNGITDAREDLSGNELLDGDHPVRNYPNSEVYDSNSPKYIKPYPGPDIDNDGKDDEWDFEFELSPFNIDNNNEVELPVVGSLGEMDPNTENTLEQVLKMIVTHELGHNVGITIHSNDATCAMNNESNNFIRDKHFSQSPADLVRIHNQ